MRLLLLTIIVALFDVLLNIVEVVIVIVVELFLLLGHVTLVAVALKLTVVVLLLVVVVVLARLEDGIIAAKELSRSDGELVALNELLLAGVASEAVDVEGFVAAGSHHEVGFRERFPALVALLRPEKPIKR